MTVKALMVQLRRMLLSFQIMSRIPVNLSLPFESEDMLGSMVYFPLVGAAVGALMALAAWLGHLITGSYLAAAALAMLARVSDSAIRALNQAIKLGAILFGVRAAVPRGGVHGFATGAAVAMAYMILGYGMYALLGGGAFSIVAMLGEILIGAAAGGAIGAIRANQSAKMRRAKAV